MSEQPLEINNENEASKELSVSNDTLTARQLREQAIKELGISYDDSVAMPMTELRKRIEEKNDPLFAKKQAKKQFYLEAQAKITDMQKESPEDKVTEITTPQDTTEIKPAVDQPTEVNNVLQFPTPEELANKEKVKSRKLDVKKLTAAALMAITVFGAVGATNKSNDTEKVSSGENADTATENSQGKQTTDNIFDLVKFNPKGFGEKDYNRSEQHVRDRMSTEGAFDGEKRNLAELDDHVLAKIKNNPSLMAAVLEVRESGNKDASFSLDDVNTDTRKYSVHGEHGQYSGKGQDAQDTLERSWDRGNQGKLLSDSEIKELMSKYIFINHGTNEGEFKNSIDDTTYSAGVFDYRSDLGDEIYAKKLGNGETVYFKVNKKDATRDCLNVQTLILKSDITTTPGTPGTPPPTTDTPPPTDTPPKTPPKETPPTTETPPIDDDKKPWEAPQGHDNGDHLAPTPAPTTDQDQSGNTPGGNPTNPEPVQTPRPEPAPAPEPGTGNGTAPVNPSH